ncbi:zf-TFIIB domain-containing protein [Chitinophaga sp.]|uniref:TFIIB-type zinc ribbon-containing protein n=1 Tax=Chitinophaga sp. TaxID=1869181 RepID=UPI0031D4AB2C
MKCPNCNETLLMTHRNNIEIDYCPNCRGIWLDKGELDKLLEQEARQGDGDRGYDRDRDRDRKYDQPRYDERHYPRKKKGFLGDFFDFD